MRKIAFAIALLTGSAAFAQIDVVQESQAWDGDKAITTAFETEGADGGGVNPVAAVASAAGAAVATSAIVQPGNSNPERDARGIAVISAPAMVPPGWNGTAAGAAMGGPLLDPATGEPAAPAGYPACTASVTDKCLQTYERGRR